MYHTILYHIAGLWVGIGLAAVFGLVVGYTFAVVGRVCQANNNSNKNNTTTPTTTTTTTIDNDNSQSDNTNYHNDVL